MLLGVFPAYSPYIVARYHLRMHIDETLIQFSKL